MERGKMVKQVDKRNSCSNNEKRGRKGGGEAQKGNADTNGI